MAENIGKVIQVSGPRWTCSLKKATMPSIYQALRVTSDGSMSPRPSASSSKSSSTWRGTRQTVAMGSHRRHGSRMKVIDLAARLKCLWQGDLGPHHQCHRRASMAMSWRRCGEKSRMLHSHRPRRCSTNRPRMPSEMVRDTAIKVIDLIHPSSRRQDRPVWPAQGWARRSSLWN